MIWQTRRGLAVRRGLFGSITGGDVATDLLPAVQSEGRRWRQPIGQDREGLPARLADSAPHPDVFVLVIMALTQSLPVANNGIGEANGTSPRQQFQRNHP